MLKHDKRCIGMQLKYNATAFARTDTYRIYLHTLSSRISQWRFIWNVCRGSCRDFQLKVLDECDEYFGNGPDTGAPGSGIALE